MTPVPVALALIQAGPRFFLQRRRLDAAVLPGLWEFPGGKLEPGETPRQALLRELEEELAWRPERLEPVTPLRHAYPGLEVELHPFLCEGAARPHTELAWAWFTPGDLARLPLPEASRRLLAALGPLP